MLQQQVGMQFAYNSAGHWIKTAQTNASNYNGIKRGAGNIDHFDVYDFKGKAFAAVFPWDAVVEGHVVRSNWHLPDVIMCRQTTCAHCPSQLIRL